MEESAGAMVVQLGVNEQIQVWILGWPFSVLRLLLLLSIRLWIACHVSGTPNHKARPCENSICCHVANGVISECKLIRLDVNKYLYEITLLCLPNMKGSCIFDVHSIITLYQYVALNSGIVWAKYASQLQSHHNSESSCHWLKMRSNFWDKSLLIRSSQLCCA